MSDPDPTLDVEGWTEGLVDVYTSEIAYLLKKILPTKDADEVIVDIRRRIVRLEDRRKWRRKSIIPPGERRGGT